jgi:hypothetical protein
MKRFMQVVLVVNMALAAVSGFAGYLLHVSSVQPEGVVATAEPILGHALAAIYLGFIVTLVVALFRFQRDPSGYWFPPSSCSHSGSLRSTSSRWLGRMALVPPSSARSSLPATSPGTSSCVAGLATN